MNFWFILLRRGANRLLGSQPMPDSSSEDQLDARGVIWRTTKRRRLIKSTSGRAGIGLCFRAGVGALQNITRCGRACQFSTLWHLERLQEEGGWGNRKRIHYWRIMQPLCQVSSRSLSRWIKYVSVGGNERQRECYCDCVYVFFLSLFFLLLTPLL